MPKSQNYKSNADNTLFDREMRTLRQTMGSLQTSEDKRRVKELDAIELNIRETERHMEIVSCDT